MLQKAGWITDLQRQVVFELAPSVKFIGAKKAQGPLRMVIDFTYREQGVRVLEDVKGAITTAFTIKRHILATALGLQVRVTR